MRHRRGTGAVSAIRVGPGNIAYIARLTVNGITVSSRCTKSFKDAEQQRQLLAALNDVLEAMPGAFDRVFKAAFTPGEDLVDSRPLPLCILRLQESAWRFRVRVDARACAGRLLTSRSLTSVDEALRLREEAFVAKQHGWSALRSLWARCSRCFFFPVLDQHQRFCSFKVYVTSAAIAVMQPSGWLGRKQGAVRQQVDESAEITGSDLTGSNRKQNLETRAKIGTTTGSCGIRSEPNLEIIAESSHASKRKAQSQISDSDS
eukprot:symbB.v1.2.024506.t1/scaffold2326.1/size131277/10